MNLNKKAFTLIELIIVVVIIGILALIAIPKYYASVTKARKNAVYATLNRIIEAGKAYYATYGVWPANNIWPITVVIDGDTVVKLERPVSTYASYWDGPSAECPVWASGAAIPVDVPCCAYVMCDSGEVHER